MKIMKIENLPKKIIELADESQNEGFRFLNRLITEFESGRNCFRGQGEGLFAVYEQNLLIGIGGLNIDPYAKDARIGRVRRLYVSRDHRKSGAGRLLMDAIENYAFRNFSQLHLFTDNPVASTFYESLGYSPSQCQNKSHKKQLST